MGCWRCKGLRHVKWSGMLGDSCSGAPYVKAMLPCPECNLDGVGCKKGEKCPCRQYRDCYGRNLWKKVRPAAKKWETQKAAEEAEQTTQPEQER